MTDVHQRLHRAFCEDDPAAFREVLAEHPELRAKINDPVAAFDSPVINHVRSRAMLDAVLEAGADINAKSRWWAGGFGLLHSAAPDLAAYAIERGATVDVHAAARLGLIDKLRELIAGDPDLVHARGGDGQTPLHFASTIEIAEFLLNHGAAIDIRDVDHVSTPAQYMVRDRQEIVRFLIRRGCETDLLMAAALGDAALARRHLDSDPDCIHLRVSDEYFPMIDSKCGGTIYQWTLGWYVSPHDVAREFGHMDVFQLLMDRSPPDARFIAACWANDGTAVAALLSENPGLVASLSSTYRRHAAHAARNNKPGAVRAMLAAGLPVDATGQNGGTPLHWAAFHGNPEMTRDILQFHPPLEVTDADYHATPLGWAIYGSEHSWDPASGNYAATIEALLHAGIKVPEGTSGGTEAVKEVLRRHINSGACLNTVSSLGGG